VYKRTRGDDAAPISPELQALFDEGISQEATTIRKIQDLGYRYERGQESFGFKDLEIRGKMEGVVLKVAGGKVVGKWAAEIKKVAGYAWEKINVWEDLYGSIWHYRWLVQIQLAILHVASKEGFDDTGVLFLKNTEKNLVKPIAVPMKQDIIDETFEKARQINAHMKAGTEPERCAYTLGICKTCEFNAICCPDEPFMAGENIDDPAFIQKLRRHEIIKPTSLEYDRMDKEIKEALRGKAYAIAGPFRISGKESGRGWKCEIERIMRDEDMEKVADVFPKPKPPAKATEEQSHPDFAAFSDRIAMSKNLDQLNAVRADFQAVHAKTPFSDDEMNRLRAEFKPAYVRFKKAAPAAGNGGKANG
jgi:CRISPR/Cas system-associated exonuclease Cas4 (RecB family)